ncbi:hypothetical protein DYB32_002723 [Aphanomyces invadans]|uniref:TIR domain-containing protein n=1 Tax=Aphanomyces invadans TaxID=157072 RepID=A0A418B2F4_9STRA|nr:hypothetical protein DYB32_002723 [Aphanomyces invadans]
MISWTVQITVIHVALLASLFAFTPELRKYSYRDPSGSGTGHCDDIVDGIEITVYAAVANVIICLPTSHATIFQLYTAQRKKSYLHTICEFLVIAEIIFLVYKLCSDMYLLYKRDLYLECLRDQLPMALRTKVLVLIALDIYVFVACWYQITLFNRMRDVALGQRNIVPTNRLFEFADPDWWKLLLTSPLCDVNAMDTLGMTPLAWSCVFNHDMVVDLLLQANADVSVVRLYIKSFCLVLLVAGHESYQDHPRDNVLKLLRAFGGNLHARHELTVCQRYPQTPHDYIRERRRCIRSGMMGQLAAGQRDVMISYCHSHRSFALKVRQSLEDHHVTTWIDQLDPTGIGGGSEWREEIARGIQSASVVLAVLSEDYPRSQWCMKELAFAKLHNVPERRVTSAALKRQAIALHVQQSHDGSRCSGSSSIVSVAASDMYVFLCHGDCHLSFAKTLQCQLQAAGIRCKLDQHRPNRQMLAKDNVLDPNCIAVLLILSESSTKR